MGDDVAVFEGILAEFGEGVPDAGQYQRLASLNLAFDDSALRGLDPFSDAYRAAVLTLYRTIRGGEKPDYQPMRDEHAPAALPPNVFTGLVPWSFADPVLVAEFLHCWGHILSLIGGPRGGVPLRVLEYGPGSGQILLMLARLGIPAYGVDINPDAIASIQAQADAMGVSVHLRQGEFGDGFEGETFDRILFFEAFHHALDFMPLLERLHSRLSPGGKLILCGEPISSQPTPSIPNSWGPRFDGLSAFCIRRFGWMELGFQASFLDEALRRSGWRAVHHPFPACPRAAALVATPVPFLKPGESWTLACGDAESNGSLAGNDWSGPEGSHRWTTGPDASILLPRHAGPVRIEVALYNGLPNEQFVDLVCDGQVQTLQFVPHESRRGVVDRCLGSELRIASPGRAVSALVPGSLDHRSLGISVLSVLVTVPV